MAKKAKKDSITIPRKAMYGIAPAIAIIGLLISKKQPGPLLLFLIGISAGIVIAKGYFKK
jgi:hypothetical protein